MVSKEILPVKEKVQTEAECKHCQINGEATPPFIERVDLPLSSLTSEVLKRVTEDTDVPIECAVCYCIRSFMKLPKNEGLARLKADYEQRKRKHN